MKTKTVPKPYKHQTSAFNFIKNLNQFALFMDQGTGKSKIVIDKAHCLYLTSNINGVIIICLNYLKHQWITEQFETHYPEKYESFIYTGNIKSNKGNIEFEKFCKQTNVLKIFCINVEAFQTNTVDKYIQKFVNGCFDIFIIIDESTSIKNPKAKRTQRIVNGFRNRKYKCILSGTPTPNNPSDLYSQFDFLVNNFFKCSYFQFQHRHNILIKEQPRNRQKPYNRTLKEQEYINIKKELNRIKINPDVLFSLAYKYKTTEKNIMLINNMTKYSPFKDMVFLNQQIEPLTFKIKKEDCLDLPAKIYKKIIIEPTIEQLRLKKELKKQFFTMYDNKELTIENTLALLIRLRMINGGLFVYQDNLNIKTFEDIFKKQTYKIKRITPNPKLNALKEDLEFVPKTTSVIIWACFVEELKYIYEELRKDYDCILYYGGTSFKDRNTIITAYKNKQIQILIANPYIAGMGLNLQVSTLHYFYSNDYRADVRIQAEDRSHRSGQTNKVMYKDLIIKDSIDEKILSCLKNKINIIDFFKNNLKEIIY